MPVKKDKACPGCGKAICSDSEECNRCRQARKIWNPTQQEIADVCQQIQAERLTKFRYSKLPLRMPPVYRIRSLNHHG